ncbi:hypothetical protein BSKO_11646 [Bryopsis sp. KO-2023]|nr:hypothetical protein BSKO_11646 [Bryopsis sp. KO-2023]
MVRHTNGERKPVGFVKTRSFVSLRELRFLFHMVSFLFFMRVWIFHTSRGATSLKGHGEFGWFFRYLTFWSFSLQTWHLFLSTLVDLSKKATKYRLKKGADDLGCMAFATANTVTLMYYALLVLTGNIDEGDRIVWLSTAVHLLNSIVAWIDIFTSYPRRFSPRSKVWTGVFALIYCGWINYIRYHTGFFPYPFLNALPHPHGILGVAVVGCVVLLCFSQLGAFVSNWGRKVMDKWEEEDPAWSLEENVVAAKAARQAERPKELYEELKVE